MVLVYAYSDVARSFGAYGGGNYQGVLRFEFEDEPPLIVGVGKMNFYLDVWYGSNRQMFYSRPLAEALKRFLKSQDIAMPKDMYNNISGLRHMELPDIFGEGRSKSDNDK
jgi:hypothetical protein